MSAPSASFSTDTNSGVGPLPVSFTNTSSGASYYSWNFGVPYLNACNSVTKTSAEISPTYIFRECDTSNASEDFNVTLTAVGTGGVSTVSKTITILSMYAPPAEDLPVASFSVDKSAGAAPLPVVFTNTSTGASVSSWDFGDGSSSPNLGGTTSPTHTYARAGSYTVTLRATNRAGTATVQKTIVVTSSAPLPTASFTVSKSTGAAPLTVSFTNTSESEGATSYDWVLGDGTGSSAVSPTHTFSHRGYYLARLTVTNASGTASTAEAIVVTIPPPKARFTASEWDSEFSQGPLTVIFWNTSTYSESDSWNFGDNNTATFPGYPFQSPAHTYAEPGTYTVTFTVENSAGTDTLSKTITVPDTSPQTTIESGPSGATSNSTPSFSFSASETGSSFQCSLDGADFSACTSPYTSTALADGAHSFSVRAGDPAGNTDASPATRSFTVDTVAPTNPTTNPPTNPPETTINSGVSGATKKSSGKVFAYLTDKHFRLSQAGKVKFVYSFSPQSKRFGYVLSIKRGARWLAVRSVTSTGRFQGSRKMTIKQLFARKLIKIGRYRLKLSADTNQKVLTFKVE
jgi:PKD repeat protein